MRRYSYEGSGKIRLCSFHLVSESDIKVLVDKKIKLTGEASVRRFLTYEGLHTIKIRVKGLPIKRNKIIVKNKPGNIILNPNIAKVKIKKIESKKLPIKIVKSKENKPRKFPKIGNFIV